MDDAQCTVCSAVDYNGAHVLITSITPADVGQFCSQL